jgi:hypothetical protein
MPYVALEGAHDLDGVDAARVENEESDSRSQHLMPNSLTIAGLQHIINNLCEDVHKSLAHWDVFFKQLKCLESFLRIEERRARFVWTCLRNTPMSGLAHRFDKFKGSLYEARWHEVDRS